MIAAGRSAARLKEIRRHLPRRVRAAAVSSAGQFQVTDHRLATVRRSTRSGKSNQATDLGPDVQFGLADGQPPPPLTGWRTSPDQGSGLRLRKASDSMGSRRSHFQLATVRAGSETIRRQMAKAGMQGRGIGLGSLSRQGARHEGQSFGGGEVKNLTGYFFIITPKKAISAAEIYFRRISIKAKESDVTVI